MIFAKPRQTLLVHIGSSHRAARNADDGVNQIGVGAILASLIPLICAQVPDAEQNGALIQRLFVRQSPLFEFHVGEYDEKRQYVSSPYMTILVMVTMTKIAKFLP